MSPSAFSTLDCCHPCRILCKWLSPFQAKGDGANFLSKASFTWVHSAEDVLCLARGSISVCRSRWFGGFLKQKQKISLILYLNLTLETLKLVRCWIRRRIVTIYNGSGLHWHYFICWLSDLKQAEHAEDYIWQKSCDLVVHATEERRQPSGCAFTLVRLFP